MNDNKTIIKMYLKGMSSSEIACSFKVSNVTILNRLRYSKIKIRTHSEVQLLLNHKGKRNPNYKHGKCCTIHRCVDCNKIIDRLGRSARCHKCSGKYYRGYPHHAYIHGNANNYPQIFSYKLKSQIRTRDNFTCQKCGITEEKHNKKLHVHHIDYNKENCKESNLITLCGADNSNANSNRDYWFAYYTYLMEYYTMNKGELQKVVREENF